MLTLTLTHSMNEMTDWTETWTPINHGLGRARQQVVQVKGTGKTYDTVNSKHNEADDVAF